MMPVCYLFEVTFDHGKSTERTVWSRGRDPESAVEQAIGELLSDPDGWGLLVSDHEPEEEYSCRAVNKYDDVVSEVKFWYENRPSFSVEEA